jgi:hypothetical protein
MPFARNEATAFISPTKTPEYLAGGRPVVSTSIRDVVRPYGRDGLVRIADDPGAFVAACEAAMLEDPAERVGRADRYLAGTSWDRTWASMVGLVERAAQQRSVAAERSLVDDDRPAVRSVVPEARPIPASSSPGGYASAAVIAAAEATRLDGRATRRGAATTDGRPRSPGRSDR